MSSGPTPALLRLRVVEISSSGAFVQLDVLPQGRSSSGTAEVGRIIQELALEAAGLAGDPTRIQTSSLLICRDQTRRPRPYRSDSEG